MLLHGEISKKCSKIKELSFFPNFVLKLKGTLSGVRQFLTTDEKCWKMFFYFGSKSLLVLKIFKFLSWLLVMYHNGLIKKIKLISIFMMPQCG